MDNLKEKAIKSVFWVGSIKFVSQAISWSVTILLIRILSPEDYGLMGIALAYKLLLSIFFDLSIGEAVLQKKDLSQEDTSTAFWICVSLGVLLYLVTWLIAGSWAAFFSNDALVDIVRVIGISVIFLSIKEIPGRLLAREFEFKRRSQFELIASLCNLSASLALALNGFGVWSLVIGELVRDVVLTLFIVFYRRWIPGFVFSLQSALRLLKFGMPVTAHYLLDYISKKSDSLIIGKTLGQEALGYYTVAMSISRIPVGKGVQIIQTVMFPLFSAIQSDLDTYRKYYFKICYIISVLFFPVFLGMWAISEEIFVIVLSPKWLPGLFSFQVFCFLGLLLTFSGIFLVLLKSRGNTKAVLLFSLLSAGLFPIGVYFASWYGLDGVALCWFVFYPIVFSLLFYFVIREIGVRISESLMQVRHAFVGASVMVLAITAAKAVLFSDSVSLGSMSFSVALGGAVYTGYFWVFSRQTFADFKSMFKMLRR